MTALILMKNPSGTWSFVGRVPAALAWCRKDGQPMTEQDYRDAAASNAPALCGFKAVSFSSKDEARAAARAVDVTITQEVG